MYSPRATIPPSVTEDGATDSYDVVLKSKPAANVVVTLDAGSQLTVDATVLTFTPTDWDTPQTVTVSAINDDVDEGPHSGTVSHQVASGDANYNGIGISDVTVQIGDNDTAGIGLVESNGSTSVTEGGATDSYDVVLESQPTANVTITLNAGTQLTVDATILTFTPDNWDTPQTVTVTAINDNVDEGPHSGTVKHTVASSDPNYGGFGLDDVAVQITDTGDLSLIDRVLTVPGTGEDDLFELTRGDIVVIKINGEKHQFPAVDVDDVVFDGMGGYDTAILISADPSADDSAELWPDHGTFTSAGVVTTLTDVESINIDGGEGNDKVVIHDSAGDDDLYARAATAAQPVSSITVTDFDYEGASFVPTYSHSVDNFENLTAKSTGGTDIASFFDSDGDDHLVAEQFKTELSGPGFDFVAEDFQFTHGYAKAGGNDLAEMYDTPQNDRFKADPEYARMFRGAYQRRSKFFETVVAYATGGYDDARLFDSLETDQFIASPTESRLYSDTAGYDITVVAFDAVLARSSGGADTATFMGGVGDDLLLHKWLRADTQEKSPKTEMMDYDSDGNLAQEYKVTARRFNRTTAIGGQGGYDIARFWDTLDDDQFLAEGNMASMSSSTDELFYDAFAFNKVVFNHVFGGEDKVDEKAHDFLLSQYWAP